MQKALKWRLDERSSTKLGYAQRVRNRITLLSPSRRPQYRADRSPKRSESEASGRFTASLQRPAVSSAARIQYKATLRAGALQIFHRCRRRFFVDRVASRCGNLLSRRNDTNGSQNTITTMAAGAPGAMPTATNSSRYLQGWAPTTLASKVRTPSLEEPGSLRAFKVRVRINAKTLTPRRV